MLLVIITLNKENSIIKTCSITLEEKQEILPVSNISKMRWINIPEMPV